MFLIVGLGNHEREYHRHRHNVGFMFVDYITKLLNGYIAENNNLTMQQFNNAAIFKHENKLQAEFVKTNFNGKQLLLAKPQTFMNNSGQAVSKIVSYFDIRISDLIIVHDDLDIPLGKFKIERGRGPKLHNGIRSIEQQLGTADFWRVRIGVDSRNPEHHIAGEAYVLENFKPEERKTINEAFPKIWERIQKELLIPNP